MAPQPSALLPPTPQPLGIFPSFIAKQTESLILREKGLSLSGADDFSIKLLDGRSILQVRGDAFSMSGRKRVLNMQGNHMFTIRKGHFSFPSVYYAEDVTGKRFLEVEGKFSRKTHLLTTLPLRTQSLFCWS